MDAESVKGREFSLRKCDRKMSSKSTT